MKILLPEGWKQPRGYSNGISVDNARLIFVAGVIGWDENEEFQSDSFIDQFRQTLLNTKAIFEEGGAGPEHMVRMTWYITDKKEYLSNLREAGQVYRSVMGKNFPTVACVEVSGLMEGRAKIEIETTCAIET